MSAAIAAASAAALSNRRSVSRSSSSVENDHRYNHHLYHAHSAPELYKQPAIGRYESLKRRDWNHFVQYLKKRHRQPFRLSFCRGADVVEFLRYRNQTRVHASSCPYSDHSQPLPPPCSCPLPGSADALIRRLRVAFEENGGPPATNPFCSSAVRLYLEELSGSQANAEAVEE